MNDRTADSRWGVFAALLAILAVFALAACGGGANSTSSTTSQGGPSTSTTASTPTTPAPATKSGSARLAPVRRAAKSRALVRKAGHAAPFLVKSGDNSIPTYGSEAPSSELAAATASLSSYLSAREAGEWSTACAQMAAVVQKQLALLAGGGEKPEGCAAAYAKLASHIPGSARANPLVGSLAAFRVNGEKAFALFYGAQNQQYMMPMAREGAQWKVTQIEALPWPLGAPTASP